MEFMIIKYWDNMDNLRINGFIKKMPKKIKDMYIQRKNPYEYTKISILNTVGYEVKVPFTKDDVEKNYNRTHDMLKKTVEDFSAENIGIAVMEQGMPFIKNIRLSYGRAVMGIFIDEIVEKMLRLKNKDILSSKILIIDGANFITNMVLESLCENINNLTIYTVFGKGIETVAEYIQAETGLNINIIHSMKSTAFKEADVIINCAMDMENADYFYQKNSIYIDVAKNIPKLKRLALKREDMTIADSVVFETQEGIVNADALEAALFASDFDMRNFLTKEYDNILQKSIKESLKEKNICVSGFNFLGSTFTV